MDRTTGFWNIFLNIFAHRNQSAAPTTQVNFSEVEHFDIGGFSASKSSTPVSTYQPKGSVTSILNPRKQVVGAHSSQTLTSVPRARWTRAPPVVGKRPSHSIIDTVHIESNDEITVLNPPSKKAKMESRETPNDSFFNGEKDVEIVKIIDGKKALGNKKQFCTRRLSYSMFKRRFHRSTVISEVEKEDKRKYSDLLQAHVYSSINWGEKPIESAGLKTRLALNVVKSLSGNLKRSENAPEVVDLSEEKKTAGAANRVQVDRRRSVTPVTQATEKPHVSPRKSVTNFSSKFLSSKTSIDLLQKGKLLQWKENHFSNQNAQKEEIKKTSKESELLSKLKSAAKEKINHEKRESLSKQIEQYLVVTESYPVEEEEEEDILPLPKLTEEILSEISNALKGNPGEVLVEAFSLKILRRDILTIKGLNWLNDEVINFYMNLLMDRGKHEKNPSVYAFNTFFYPRLISGGHSVLKRWTKKVDIFSYDFVLAPVHLGVHWCMAIIDMREKLVKYFDSMGGQNEQCLKALRQYLCDEMMDKKKEKLAISDWEFTCMQDIPQQQNGSDCGMFSCMFAEYTTRRARITFTQADMPYFRKKMIYEIIKVKLLC